MPPPPPPHGVRCVYLKAITEPTSEKKSLNLTHRNVERTFQINIQIPATNILGLYCIMKAECAWQMEQHHKITINIYNEKSI
jgi:hypothetical protein